MWLANRVVARFSGVSGGESEVAAMAECAPEDRDGFGKCDEQQVNGSPQFAIAHLSHNEHGSYRWADARRQAAARQA